MSCSSLRKTFANQLYRNKFTCVFSPPELPDSGAGLLSFSYWCRLELGTVLLWSCSSQRPGYLLSTNSGSTCVLMQARARPPPFVFSVSAGEFCLVTVRECIAMGCRASCPYVKYPWICIGEEHWSAGFRLLSEPWHSRASFDLALGNFRKSLLLVLGFLPPTMAQLWNKRIILVLFLF